MAKKILSLIPSEAGGVDIDIGLICVGSVAEFSVAALLILFPLMLRHLMLHYYLQIHLFVTINHVHFDQR